MMGVLGYLLLFISTLITIVVIGTFSGIMFSVVLDVMSEQEQARERDKWREQKWKN